MTFRTYIFARIARLYPLFLATTLLGIAFFVSRGAREFGYVDWQAIAQSLAMNVAVLPTLTPPYGMAAAFPFNPASWTIFFEFAVSFAFFWIAGLSTRILAFSLAILAGLVALTAIKFGTLDVGWGPQNFLWAFPRAFFSFILGVVLHRLYRRAAWKVPIPIFACAIIVFLGVMQGRAFQHQDWVWLYDLSIVFLWIPALAMIGVGTALGPLGVRIAALLGQASYAVYLSQYILALSFSAASQALFGAKIYDYAPWIGFVFVAFVFTISVIVYRYFEAPARSYLRSFSASRLTQPTTRTEISSRK